MIRSLAHRIRQPSESDPIPPYLTFQLAYHPPNLNFLHFNMLILDHIELLLDHPLQLLIILQYLLNQATTIRTAHFPAVVTRLNVQVERTGHILFLIVSDLGGFFFLAAEFVPIKVLKLYFFGLLLEEHKFLRPLLFFGIACVTALSLFILENQQIGLPVTAALILTLTDQFFPSFGVLLSIC